jgi:hypothetical protein
MASLGAIHTQRHTKSSQRTYYTEGGGEEGGEGGAKNLENTVYEV